MAKKIELYTFGEIVKVLGITSSEVNDMIASGQLTPVRHKGRLKFKKIDVDKLQQTLKARIDAIKVNMEQKKEEEEYYSWSQVLRELQIEDRELRRLVDNNEIQSYEGKDEIKFRCDEIKKFKFDRQNLATILVTPQKMASPFEEIPSEDFSLDSSSNPVAPVTEEYYNSEEVLRLLQIEREALKRLLNDGELTAVHTHDGIKFKKTEVEFLREKMMIDATMVQEPEVIEEEDIQPIVISANSQEAIRFLPPEELYYTFDEAVYELQIEPEELKRMVARQELEAIRSKDGQLRFAKEEINSRAHVIEPTVILPDDMDENGEETRSIEEEPDIKLPMEKLPMEKLPMEKLPMEKLPMEKLPMEKPPMEKPPMEKAKKNMSKGSKSFYNSVDAADFLNISEEQLQIAVQDGLLRAYRYEGQRQFKYAELNKVAEKIKAKFAKAEALPVDDTKSQISNANPTAVVEEEPIDSSNYYTLGEVKKLLALSDKDVKMMVARGKLKINRKGGLYLFPKKSVQALLDKSKIANTPAPKSEPVGEVPVAEPKVAHKQSNIEKPEDLCTLKEAMEILSVGKADIQRYIDEKHLQLLPGNRLLREEITKLKQNDKVEVTMVLPLHDEQPEEEDPYDMEFISAPKPKTSKSLTEKKPPVAKKSPVTEKPSTAKTSPVTPKQPPAKAASEERPLQFLKKYFYDWNQAALELQLEEEELAEMVALGSLNYVEEHGKKWFKKSAVDTLKTGKMIEPTIMVGGEDATDDILDDDDDDDMFFLK